MLVFISLGLFLLAQLVRLRRELNTLVQYQALFRAMWEQDKRDARIRIMHKRRERAEEQRILRARAAGAVGARGLGGSGGLGGLAARASRAAEPKASTSTEGSRRGRERSPFGAGVDAALDAAPPPGPDRDAWVRTLASMTQGIRRVRQEEQQRRGGEGAVVEEGSEEEGEVEGN